MEALVKQVEIPLQQRLWAMEVLVCIAPLQASPHLTREAAVELFEMALQAQVVLAAGAMARWLLLLVPELQTQAAAAVATLVMATVEQVAPELSF